MIKTETLFILGAGASHPFGYPTGKKLRELICSNKQRPSIIQALKPVHEREDNWYEEIVNDFVKKFLRSSVYSIDLFLEYRTEFMDVGKISIGAYLISCEDDKKLREIPDNWYMYLFDRLKSSFEDFDKNNISFITFNYDRSLEQFFFEALKNRFNRIDQECAAKLKKIPIVHLYGQLDLLPWQSNDGVPYSANYNARLRNAKKNIKLFSDNQNVNESEEFQEAYKLIQKSQRIYFLGFGFDEINLERLNVQLMKGKELFGTSLGIEESKKRWLKGHFEEKINTNLFLFDLDTLELLKEYLKIE